MTSRQAVRSMPVGVADCQSAAGNGSKSQAIMGRVPVRMDSMKAALG